MKRDIISKSKFKSARRFFVFLVAVCLTQSLYAGDFEVNGIWYQPKDNRTCKVLSCDKNLTNIEIPSIVYQGDTPMSVVEIVQSAFSGHPNLASVVIPSSVTSIGGSAFAGCERLTQITIPNSVTSIGECAFEWCESLTHITIPNSVTTLEWGIFGKCINLKNVDLGNSITTIGRYAFGECVGLESITIPNSVTTINDNAFWGCSSLTDVTFGKGVTSIDFRAFSDCTALAKLTIPSNITSISAIAFEGCSGLKELIFENGTNELIFTLDYHVPAFKDCPIEKLYLGRDIDYYDSDLESIYGNGYLCSPFRDRTSLSTLTIGSSVTSIGKSVFYGCTGVKELTIEDGTDVLEFIPDETNHNAFGNCPLEKLYLGRNISYYDNYSPFSYKRTLIDVTIGDYVTSITPYAFHLCEGLTSLPIGNNVKSIGYMAFSNCNGLTSVTIGNNVTSIGDYAFYNCAGLNSVTIGNSVTSVGNNVFEYCGELASVTFGSKVASIGSDVFRQCRNLTTLYSLNTTPPVANYRAFEENLYKTVTVYVPWEALSAYKNAEVWKEFWNIMSTNDTGIENVKTNGNVNNIYYDFQGKRLQTTNIADLPKGIYIVNGKKVVVK